MHIASMHRERQTEREIKEKTIIIDQLTIGTGTKLLQVLLTNFLRSTIIAALARRFL